MKSSPSFARAYLAWFISALPGIIARAAIMNRRCNCSVREWMYLNVNYVNELKEMMARQLQYFFVSAAIWLILLAAIHIAYTLLRYHSSQTSISESSRFSQNILFHTKIYIFYIPFFGLKLISLQMQGNMYKKWKIYHLSVLAVAKAQAKEGN